MSHIPKRLREDAKSAPGFRQARVREVSRLKQRYCVLLRQWLRAVPVCGHPGCHRPAAWLSRISALALGRCWTHGPEEHEVYDDDGALCDGSPWKLAPWCAVLRETEEEIIPHQGVGADVVLLKVSG